jgi:hypothetical protein
VACPYLLSRKIGCVLLTFFGLIGLMTMTFQIYQMYKHTDDRAYVDLGGQGSSFRVTGLRFGRSGAWRVYHLIMQQAYHPCRCQVLKMNVHVRFSQYCRLVVMASLLLLLLIVEQMLSKKLLWVGKFPLGSLCAKENQHRPHLLKVVPLLSFGELYIKVDFVSRFLSEGVR